MSAIAAALALASTLVGDAVMAQDVAGRVDVRARAPEGTSSTTLGRFYDADFRPLVGAANRLALAPGDVVETSTVRTEHQFRVVSSEDELRANAGIWGITAGHARLRADHFAYFRAVEVTSARALSDDVSLPSEFPSRAAYYVSAVYLGRMYEARFQSATRSIESSLGGRTLTASGSISAFAADHSLSVQVQTLGLEPAGDEALLTETAAELRSAYRATGPTVPILVRYSRVPTDRRVVHASEVVGYRVEVDSVEFPSRKPGSGNHWDAFGGSPEIGLRVHFNGGIILEPPHARETLRWDLAAIRREHPTFGVIERVAMSADSVLEFEFFDVDLSDHDAAGRATVTVADFVTAPAGRLVVNVGNGVQARIRVTRLD